MTGFHSGSQGGQATLVAAMVTMVMVFAVAGGLALGTSSLLAQGRSTRAGFETDLAAQNTITAALAHVVRQPGAGSPDPGTCHGLRTQSSQASSSIPTLPGSAAAWCLAVYNVKMATTTLNFTTTATCGRIQTAVSSTSSNTPANFTVWVNMVTPSPVDPAAYLPTVYISDSNSELCSSPNACTTVGSPGGDPVTVLQYAFRCTSDLDGSYVHIKSGLLGFPGGAIPLAARYAAADSSAGVMYTVVAPISIGPRPAEQAEEADLWVPYNPGGNPPSVLTWEAAL